MKYVTAILAISIFMDARADVTDNNILLYDLGKAVIDGKLIPFLENVKLIMRTENSSLGIPVLDPYEKDYKNVSYSDDAISIAGNFTNIKVDGLSYYTVNDFTFQMTDSKVMLDVTWPKITYKSRYNMQADFTKPKQIPIYGMGGIRVNITRFRLVLVAILGLKDEIFVKGLTTEISAGDIEFDANGIYNNDTASKKISAITSSLLLYIIEHHQKMLSKQVNTKLMNWINGQLNDFSLPDVASTLHDWSLNPKKSTK